MLALAPADCTLVIPVSDCKQPDADLGSTPRMCLRLHRNCLCAKSAFLRGLLSGVSIHDLIRSRTPSCSQSLRIPQSRLPRILPSPPSHPTILLPVPDPSSILLLIHWMYLDNTDHIENALHQGDIQWEGLVRNVEYLGLSTDIKVFLGSWYRDWLLPCSPQCTPHTDEDEDEDSEDWDSDPDYDDYDYYPSTPPTDDDSECLNRGRTRDIKHLLQSCMISNM